MTFDDDTVRLHLSVGTINVPLMKIGLTWPPPERIIYTIDEGWREAREDDESALIFKRTNYSPITDEERETLTHVFRGAEYRYESA